MRTNSRPNRPVRAYPRRQFPRWHPLWHPLCSPDNFCCPSYFDQGSCDARYHAGSCRTLPNGQQRHHPIRHRIRLGQPIHRNYIPRAICTRQWSSQPHRRWQARCIGRWCRCFRSVLNQSITNCSHLTCTRRQWGGMISFSFILHGQTLGR